MAPATKDLKKPEVTQKSKVLPQSTPKRKENKAPAVCGSVTKTAQKTFNRRPRPAHSGVPLPEKMKQLQQSTLNDIDCVKKAYVTQKSKVLPPNTPNPKPKVNRVPTGPGTVTKSAQKTWNRRPRPAHSGVPLPQNMKLLLQENRNDFNLSF